MESNKFRNYEIYLLISSCFFLVPAFYAAFHRQRIYAVLSFLTVIFSLNYWRKGCISGFRRNCDIFMARLSGLTYMISGLFFLFYSTRISITVVFLLDLILLVSFYIMSCHSFHKKKQNWYIYHVFFHFFASFGKLVVLKLHHFHDLN